MNAFEEVARRVREDLDALGCGRETFGIIHRDLKLEDLLFREEGAVGAIDFDMSGMGHYLLDLAVVTGSSTTSRSRSARVVLPVSASPSGAAWRGRERRRLRRANAAEL